MIKENYLLAAGSRDFSKKLAAIVQSRGWQALSLTNKQNAVRFSKEMQIAPQFFVADKLTDWIIRLSRELHPQGTQIILSVCMAATQEELERILGVPYYSISGLPSKVASVLLKEEIEA